MGGNAFDNLHTPRISHEVYHQIRAQCQAILQTFYEEVVSPPEAPEKLDHGDVDFLVAKPKAIALSASQAGGSKKSTADQPVSAQVLADALRAFRVKKTFGSKTTHFALLLLGADLTSTIGSQPSYVQVDVHVCPSNLLHWELLLQSYGDLAQIIGILNRPIGLTANDKGLHLRIPEIEPHNRKASMIFLTQSPRDMLSFLGLDADEYYSRGFKSNEEVFEWCFAGRFWHTPRLETETSNDRQRLRKRDMFGQCMRDWYPLHKERLFPEERKQWTREEVREEALRWFGAEARQKYERAMEAHKQAEWEREILEGMRDLGVKRGVANSEKIGEVIRGSKRFVRYEQTPAPSSDPEIQEEPKDTPGKEPDGGWALSQSVLETSVSNRPSWFDHISTAQDKERFLSWLDTKWDELRALEKQRMADNKEKGLGRPK